MAGLPKSHRLRTSLTLAGFEALMPGLGVLLGQGLSEFIGAYATFAAAAVLAMAGLIMLRSSSKKHEQQQSRLLGKAQGLAIIYLGLSISIDEIALGLSLGLLRVPLLMAVIMIGAQAFVASQLGLRAGDRLSQRFRETAEKIAGVALIIVAAAIVMLAAIGGNL